MRRALAALALCLAGCGDAQPSEPVEPGAFVAFDRDFLPYTTWPRTDLGSLSLAGHPPGPRWVHLNRVLSQNATEYPVGTILVKVVQAEPDPTQWVLFAMVKRGGTYNASGARGWEYFVLRLSREAVPVIVSRGLAPNLVGSLYTVGDGLGCNSCHGTEDARMFDGILTPSLRPGAR